MNKETRTALIDAMSSGNAAEVQRIQQQEIDRVNGVIIWGEMQTDRTWRVMVPCFHILGDNPLRLTEEEFARYIVKYNFQVYVISSTIPTGIIINPPDYTADPPDWKPPREDPAVKLQKVLETMRSLEPVPEEVRSKWRRLGRD